MAKKITKIKIGTGEAREIEDAMAIKSINGYDKTAIDTAEVTFANEAISQAKIEALFVKTNMEENR